MSNSTFWPTPPFPFLRFLNPPLHHSHKTILICTLHSILVEYKFKISIKLTTSLLGHQIRLVSKYILFYHLYYELRAQHTLVHYLQNIFVAKLEKKIHIYINRIVVNLYIRCWWCYQHKSPQHYKWRLCEVFLL